MSDYDDAIHSLANSAVNKMMYQSISKDAAITKAIYAMINLHSTIRSNCMEMEYDAATKISMMSLVGQDALDGFGVRPSGDVMAAISTHVDQIASEEPSGNPFVQPY